MITMASDGSLALVLSSSSTPIQDRILLSLFTRRGSSWQRPDFGSDLHKLRRAKLTPDLPKTAEGYARSATRWMLEEGMVDSFFFQATKEGSGKLRLEVRAVSSSQSIKITYWIPIPADPR